MILGSPEHRARVVRKARKARAAIAQIFTDAASWNQFSEARKAGCAPIDPDPDGRMAQALAALDKFLAEEPAVTREG